MAQPAAEEQKNGDNTVEIPSSIPSTMKGLRKTKKQKGFDFVTDLQVPEPGPDEVLVKSYRVGICGSDLILYDWTEKAQVIAAVPFTPGHEVSGLVLKIGDNVSKEEHTKHIKIGSRVAIENHFFCNNCYQCKHDRKDICQNMNQLGHGKGTEYGGCSEYFLVRAEYCYCLKENISWRDAAVLEPLGVALNACHTADVSTSIDDTWLIIGSGTIGLLATAVLKAYKVKKIIVFDVLDWKLKIATQFGADIAINVSTQWKSQDVNNDGFLQERIDFIMKETKNEGVGRIIEASGHSKTISTMFKLLRKGGIAVLVGLPKTPLIFNDPMPDIVFKSLQIRTIHGRRIFSTWEEAEQLVSKQLINLDPIVTDEIPLSKFEEGYTALKSGRALKIIFDPTK